MDPMTMAMLAQFAGQGLSGLFGKKHKGENAAIGELDQLPGMMKGYYDPYVQQGLHPGENINQIGQSFQQSPGFDFAMKRALAANNNQAAAGGMYGTPQNQFQNMETATGLANQDYYNWLDRAQGQQQMGMHGTDQLTQSLMDQIMNKAGIRHSGAMQAQQQRNMGYGGLLGAFGGMAAGGGMGGMGDWFKGAGATPGALDPAMYGITGGNL